MSIKSLEYWIEINTSQNAECGYDSQTHARPMRDPCLAHAGPMRDHAVSMPCPCRDITILGWAIKREKWHG